LALIWVKWLLTVGLAAQVEDTRALGQRVALAEQLEDLELALRQLLELVSRRRAVAVQKRWQHVAADKGFATRDPLESLQQGIDLAALGDKTQRAGFERPFEQHLRVMHTIDQDGCPRVECTDATDGFDAAEAIHAEIHDYGVWTLRTVFGVGRFATADLQQHTQRRIGIDQAAQAGA